MAAREVFAYINILLLGESSSVGVTESDTLKTLV